MSRKYCLLTGATGFIGSHIARRLAGDSGITVVAIVRKKNNYKNVDALRSMGVILEEGEFFLEKVISPLFSKYSFSYVVHAAAIRGGGRGKRDEYWRVNVDGTENILRAAQKTGVEKFIYCSTVGVMGTIPVELPAGPHTVCNPDGNYHVSKHEAEKIVLEYRDKGVDAVIVRPTITYGEGSSGFPEMLVSMITKRMLPLSEKEVLIHLLDVNAFADLVISICNMKEKAAPIIIAADRKPVSVRRLADIIHHALYGSEYPSWIVVPGFVFAFLSAVFRLLKSDKWLTRVELISCDWYYDIDDAVRKYGYNASCTEETFVKEMGIDCAKKRKTGRATFR